MRSVMAAAPAEATQDPDRFRIMSTRSTMKKSESRCTITRNTVTVPDPF